MQFITTQAAPRETLWDSQASAFTLMGSQSLRYVLVLNGVMGPGMPDGATAEEVLRKGPNGPVGDDGRIAIVIVL